MNEGDAQFDPAAALGDELMEMVVLHLEGRLTGPQRDRLNALLAEDPSNRDTFVAVCTHASLLASRVGIDEGVELPHQLDPEPQIPEPPFPTLSTTHYPLPTSHFSVGSWAFSYMVATVIMGMMLLGFWAYEITHHQHIAEAPSQSVPSDAMPEMVFVGRITGMVDVKWSDDPRFLPPLSSRAYVPLGRKYILDSGLLEITYDSGAKVILEGPCTYEVESTAGGYLSLGKLTARVEQRGAGRGTRGEDGSHYPLSTTHYPLFSVRTPTAIITDLGTEFGVEVGKEGTTTSHVFRGKVEVRLTDGGGEARAIQLGANESARVEPGADRIVVVGREAAAPGAFTRRMPKWVRIELFNTGVGLKEGEPDPHWQLVAVSDALDFQPRPAVVTAAHAYWLANDPTRSQWLSTANGPPDVPNITYTFSTTFELTDMLPETVVLRGRFIVDNHVQAIRLNGRQLSVPEHGERAFNSFSGEFSAGKHCIKGINTLEIDILNGVTWRSDYKNGPMGLRVELSGSVLSKKKGG